MTNVIGYSKVILVACLFIPAWGVASCLDLPTNAEIAKCAEKMAPGGKSARARGNQQNHTSVIEDKSSTYVVPASPVVKRDPKIHYVVSSKEMTPGEIRNRKDWEAARARLDAEIEEESIKTDIRIQIRLDELRREEQRRAYEREIALRQQEIAARNRQAAAIEAAAEAAHAAARSRQFQEPAPPPAVIINRPMRCNFQTGWCN